MPVLSIMFLCQESGRREVKNILVLMRHRGLKSWVFFKRGKNEKMWGHAREKGS